MTKKDFFDLLMKFEKGNCSKEEEELLFKFYEDFQPNDIMGHWSLSEREQAKVRVLKRIHKSILGQKRLRFRRSMFVKISRVAVISIALIGLGYLYMHISSEHTFPVPTGDVTLELDDGSVKVMRQERVADVVDNNGDVIGEQDGNRLTYTKTGSSEELKYNRLTVPYGKTFELRLSDGTMAYLNSGSSLKYPVRFIKGSDRQVFVSGEAFLDVAKDSLHPFIVNTGNLNVQVLGTKFNVHAYPEDSLSEIVLVEGSVGLYAEEDTYNAQTSTHLQPGHKASFDRVNKEISKEPVITDIYTSWLNGELVFRDMPFDNMLKKLERHYDVTIINENKNLAREKFNASFRKVSLDRVLKNLRKYHGIQYVIHGNIITIK